MKIPAPWLNVIYTPGFSPVQQRCIAAVSRDGELHQQLVRCEAGVWDVVEAEHETQLDAGQLEALEETLLQIDFARLAARVKRARDGSRLAIEWRPLEAEARRVEGCILSDYQGYHDFALTFEPAQRFWRSLYDLLPHKFLERA